MRGFVIALAIATASCHLADKEEPPKCEEGTHVELNRCVQDETEKIRIVLTATTPCPTITPDTFKVKVGEKWQFENQSATAYTIKGTIDGQTWVSVPANGLSLGMSIAKAGTWKYVVSECGSTGTVVVE